MLLRRIALVIAALCLAPCAGAQEKVRVTYANNSLTFLTAFIAKDRGFFARNGLNAELIQARPAVNIAALLSGDVDYVEVFGSAIRSAAKGAPIRAFSNSIKAPFFSLIAQPSIKSIKDLKGRVIGVTSIGGTNQISGRLLFQHFGVDPDKELKFLAIGEEKFLVEAFKAKRVDAILVAPPFSIMMKREGYSVLANAADVVAFPLAGLSTTVDKIRQNRSQVKRVLKSEIEALKYLRDGRCAGARRLQRRRQRVQPRCPDSGRRGRKRAQPGEKRGAHPRKRHRRSGDGSIDRGRGFERDGALGVHDEIEASRPASGFAQVQQQLRIEYPVAPVFRLAGKIELRGQQRTVRRLHAHVKVTRAARIKSRHDRL